MTDRTAQRVAEILAWADRLEREENHQTIADRVNDTLGPNPCDQARFINTLTGEEIGTTCDRKRCPHCGPRKQLTIRLQLQAGFGDIDTALQLDKKRRQRHQVSDLTYQIVGDDNLGYVLITNRPLLDSQRRMTLKDWMDRILDLYHRAGQRIRRSRNLGRIGLVPNSHKSRRANGDTPIWRYLNKADIKREIRETMLHFQNKELYSVVQILLKHGFSPGAINPPANGDRPVPY